MIKEEDYLKAKQIEKTLVKLKNDDKSFYVKMSISFTFGIPTGHWIGLEDKKIYHSDELLFIGNFNLK